MSDQLSSPVKELKDSSPESSISGTENMEAEALNSAPQDIPDTKPEIKIEPITESLKSETRESSVEKAEIFRSYTPDYDGSDDDYTNDYSEISTKRRRRETRSYTASQAKPYVQLRGQYSITDNLCTWEGMWGMAVNGIISGLVSDFKLSMPRKQQSNSLSGPQSGDYDGFFYIKVDGVKKVPEKGVHLEFVPDGSIYRVKGRGSNNIGAYYMEGTYNPETMDMVCSRVYEQSQVGHSTRQRSRGGYSEVVPEREYRGHPRQATPSFLRESVDLPPGLNEDMKMCFKSLKRLMNHKLAYPFLTPVDPVALKIPDYFQIIKEPMDLGTIQKNIENHVILNRDDFALAVRKVFDNALLYNKPTDDVYTMAKKLSEFFEKDFMQMTRRIYETEPEPSSPVYSNKIQRHSVASRSKQRTTKGKNTKKTKGKNVPTKATRRPGIDEEYIKMKNRVDALKNKVDMMKEKLRQIGGESSSTDVATPMSREEKKALSLEIHNLSGDNLQNIIKIIEDVMPLDPLSSDGEVVIDLDAMPNEALRKLQDFVRSCQSTGQSGERNRHVSDLGNQMTMGRDAYDHLDVDSDNSVEHDFF